MPAPGGAVAFEIMSTDVVAERQFTYEEERGKPMPNVNHSRVQGRLTAQLLRQDRYEVCPELTIQPDPTIRKMTPDLCLLPFQPSDWANEPPVESRVPPLVVEIQSPSQTLGEVSRKVRDYHRLGVDTVWLFAPEFRSLTILSRSSRPEQHTSGVVTDAGTGATVDLDAVYA